MLSRLHDLRGLVRDERGISLIELLVTITIGMVVFGGILSLTESGARSAARTNDRTDSNQRGRTALNAVVQGLRTQVCPASNVPPVASATKDANGVEQLTYYTEQDTLNQASPSPTFAPQKRRLTFDPRSGGSIVQEIWEANGTGSPPTAPFTWPTTPTRTQTLLTGLKRVNINGSDVDFLRYFSFENSTALTLPLSTVTTVQGTTPIPTNSIAKVVRIDVSYETLPSSGNTDTTRDTDLQTTVYVRNSDYTSQTDTSNKRVWGPRCD